MHFFLPLLMFYLAVCMWLHISETQSETESSAGVWVIFMHTGRSTFCCCVYMSMTFWRYILHIGSNQFINIRTGLVASNNHTIVPVFGTFEISISFCSWVYQQQLLREKSTGKRIGSDFCPSVVGDVNLITCRDSVSFK